MSICWLLAPEKAVTLPCSYRKIANEAQLCCRDNSTTNLFPPFLGPVTCNPSTGHACNMDRIPYLFPCPITSVTFVGWPHLFAPLDSGLCLFVAKICKFNVYTNAQRGSDKLKLPTLIMKLWQKDHPTDRLTNQSTDGQTGKEESFTSNNSCSDKSMGSEHGSVTSRYFKIWQTEGGVIGKLHFQQQK